MKYTATHKMLGDEEGFGLLFALMALAAVGVIGWSMMTTGMIDMTISDNFRSKSAAFYAADAGIEQSLVDLKVDSTWIDEIVDPATWELIPLSSSSLTINGHTLSLSLDGSGYIVPGYYSFGPSTSIGTGNYTREIYLPPALGEYTGDCEDPTSSGGSGTGSTSGSGGSGGSGSGGSSAALAPPVSTPQLGLAAMTLISAAKVEICHIPPGNPSNSHTLVVSTNALSAHTAHGDTTGACAASSGSTSGSGSGPAEDPCDLVSSGPTSSGSDGSGSGGSGSSSSASAGSGSGGFFARIGEAVARASMALATPMFGIRKPGHPANGIESEAAYTDSGSSSGGSSSGGSTSGGSTSGGSTSGGSTPGGSTSGGSSSSSNPEPVEELVFTLRSTGTGAQVEMGSQTLYADLVFAVDQDSNVLEIWVRNWRQDR